MIGEHYEISDYLMVLFGGVSSKVQITEGDLTTFECFMLKYALIGFIVVKKYLIKIAFIFVYI